MKLRSALTGLAVVLTLGACGVVYTPAPAPSPRILPPQCEGTGEASFCFIDLPDCSKYVFSRDDGATPQTWFVQNWCTGETVVD